MICTNLEFYFDGRASDHAIGPLLPHQLYLSVALLPKTGVAFREFLHDKPVTELQVFNLTGALDVFRTSSRMLSRRIPNKLVA